MTSTIAHYSLEYFSWFVSLREYQCRVWTRLKSALLMLVKIKWNMFKFIIFRLFFKITEIFLHRKINWISILSWNKLNIFFTIKLLPQSCSEQFDCGQIWMRVQLPHALTNWQIAIGNPCMELAAAVQMIYCK